MRNDTRLHEHSALTFRYSPPSLTCAVYVGMLLGALVWGFGADIIGRKLAFNVSLLFSAIFTIAAGASPNWIALGSFACLAAFGAGGNLVLDTAVVRLHVQTAALFLSDPSNTETVPGVPSQQEAMAVDAHGRYALHGGRRDKRKALNVKSPSTRLLGGESGKL